MINVFTIYIISALAIVLGFIALLKQKTYIDTNTQQPTQIEIPFFGKMKTNFPALIFVFLGFGLAYVCFNKSYPPPKIPWEITGSFKTTDNHAIDWDKGDLSIVPADFRSEISSRGEFRITLLIDEGKTFEDVVERIDYSHPRVSTNFIPKEQYVAKTKKRESFLEDYTKTTRNYRPITVNLFNIINN